MTRYGCLAFALAVAAPAGAAESPRMGAPRAAAGVSLAQCRLVVPDRPELRAGAAELARAIEGRGGKATVVSPAVTLPPQAPPTVGGDQGAAAPPETLVLVGSIVSNRAMLPLYAAVLLFADAWYPGGDGCTLRTLFDAPARGQDAIALEASSNAGAVRALRRFTERIAALPPGDLLPRTLEVELGGEARSALGRIGVPREATPAGYLHGLTGDARFAQAARAGFLAPAAAEGYYTESDYALEPLLRSWALVCDSGAFTPEEVRTVHQLFLGALVQNQGMYWRARDGSRIGSRHQTMGTSAFLSIVRHLLRRGSPDPAAAALLAQWRGECEAWFANALTTFHDDMEGIPSYHSVQPLLNYALETGVPAYLQRAGEPAPLETAILRAYAAVDNLGYYCGTGTYEEARPGTVKAGIMLGYPLAAAACVNGDGRAAWLLRHFPGARVATWGLISGYGARAFSLGGAVPEVEPRDLLGVTRVPLGQYRYARLPREADAKDPARLFLPAPPERAFEKLCFRDRFEPDGQYLVLQGFQAVGADNAIPLDANSIIRYTDGGAVWLIANTERQGNFYRNAVFVSDGESSAPGWAGCELLGEATTPRISLVASRLGSYGGAEWTRHLLWLRGRAFAVIDGVRFETPGERQVFCTFRSAPPADLAGREWTARSGTASFHLLNADDVPMTSRRDGPDGAAIPTLLRQTRAVDARPGTRTAFRNLFYVSTPERPRRFEVRPLGETALLIRDAGANAAPGLFAIRGADGQARAGEFTSDGEAFYVGPEGAAAVGGKEVRFQGQPVADGPLPAGTATALRALWEQAAPAGPVTGPPSPPNRGGGLGGPERPEWRFAGIDPRRPAVLSPVVSASAPPDAGALDDLVDGFIPLWTGDASWQNPKGVTLTFDLRAEEGISGIEFATGILGRPNTLPDVGSLPERRVTVQFSSDGFTKDTRGGPATFRPGCTIEPLHKGTVFGMGRWTLAGVRERARWVRLIFAEGPVALREVYIRRATGTEARFGPSLVADVDGDGTEEIAAASDDGQLLLLGTDGRERWRRRFAGAVTCLRTADLGPGIGRVLLIGTREARLYCLTPEGRERWVTDFLPLGGDLPTPYSIGVMPARARPPQAPPTVGGAGGAEGDPILVMGNYARISFVSTEGALLGHTFAFGAFQTMMLSDGADLTGDGVPDALSFSVWANLSVVDGAKQSVPRWIGCPRGEGLLLRRWAGGKVLVASDNGVGVVDPATGRYDWQRTLAPLTCAATADVDRDGREEILLGKRDGWLLLLDAEGKVRRKVRVGDEVRSLAVSPADPTRVWIATGAGVRRLDAALATRAEHAAAVQRLEALSDGRIVALGEDGSVMAFR